MPLPFNKNFDEINEEDIRSLIDHSVRENQNLEYKSECWKHNDEEVREMLRDITSMTNAYGGYIIIGIKEDKDGLPVEISEINDAESERDRIISSCLANISPRLIGIKLRVISVNSKNILIIFMPRGIRSPYMITYKGLYQFWIRHDRQKSRMSVDEIRDVILKTENLYANIKEFIKERKKEILNEIGEKAYYIMGAIPLSTVRENVVDILDPNIRNILENPPKKRDYAYGFYYGTDIRSHCTLHGLEIGGEDNSMELFRNSYLEARIKLFNEVGVKTILRESISRNGKEINILTLNPLVIIEYCVNFYRVLNSLKNYLGLEETLVGFISLYRINGLELGKYLKDNSCHNIYNPWDKMNLEISLSQIPDLLNPSKVAKYFCDRIWQAFGWDYAPLWDKEEQRFKYNNDYI